MEGSPARDGENEGRGRVRDLPFGTRGRYRAAAAAAGCAGAMREAAGGVEGAQPDRQSPRSHGAVFLRGGRRERLYRGGGVAAPFSTVAQYF